MSQFTSFVGIDQTTGDTFDDKLMYTRRINNQTPSDFGGIERSRIRHRCMDSSGNTGNKNKYESYNVEQLSQSERRYRRMRNLNNLASKPCRLRRKRTSRKFISSDLSSEVRTSRVQSSSRPHSSSGKTK